MVLHKIANRETFFETNYVFSVGNHNIWCVKIKKNQGLSRAWEFRIPINSWCFEDFFFALAILWCKKKMCSCLSEVFLVLHRNAFLEGYVQQFLYTFRYFCTQEEFLQFLLDRISRTLSRYSNFLWKILSKYNWLSSQYLFLKITT